MLQSLRRLVVSCGVAALLASVVPPALSAAPGGRTLYLTFDADMTPGMLQRLRKGEVRAWYDPAILDFLDEHRLPAAVFVTGLFAEAYPDLLRRLSTDPLFTVGVHGYRHSAYTLHCYGLPALTTDDQKLQDATMAREAIRRIAGREPVLFRYPGLCHDAHDDELVRKAGLKVDQPDVIAGDAFNRNVDAIVWQVFKQAKDGGTVVMHLGGPNAPSTLDALKKLVPLLEKKGYRFAAK